MLNIKWINDIREQISNDKDLLNNFNKYADIFVKYSKFEPNVYFSKHTRCICIVWGDHINGILDVIINLNFSGGTFKKGPLTHDLSKVKESDFPEPDIKIVHRATIIT